MEARVPDIPKHGQNEHWVNGIRVVWNRHWKGLFSAEWQKKREKDHPACKPHLAAPTMEYQSFKFLLIYQLCLNYWMFIKRVWTVENNDRESKMVAKLCIRSAIASFSPGTGPLAAMSRLQACLSHDMTALLDASRHKAFTCWSQFCGFVAKLILVWLWV